MIKAIAEINTLLRKMIEGLTDQKAMWFLASECGYSQEEADGVDLMEAVFAEVEIPVSFDVESVHASIINIVKLHAVIAG